MRGPFGSSPESRSECPTRRRQNTVCARRYFARCLLAYRCHDSVPGLCGHRVLRNAALVLGRFPRGAPIRPSVAVAFLAHAEKKPESISTYFGAWSSLLGSRLRTDHNLVGVPGLALLEWAFVQPQHRQGAIPCVLLGSGGCVLRVDDLESERNWLLAKGWLLFKFTLGQMGAIHKKLYRHF